MYAPLPYFAARMPAKLLPLLLLMVGLWLVLHPSCGKETPMEPPRDNPLDIHNPATGGDPFNLQVEATEAGLRLRWTPVEDVASVVGYAVYRQVDGQEFTRWRRIDAKTTGTAVDTTLLPSHRYTYYVVVYAAGGRESEADAVKRASWGAPPKIVINDGVAYTANHEVELTLKSYGAQYLQVSTDSAFTGAAWETFTASRTWTLADGHGKRQVYARVVCDNGDTSAASVAALIVGPNRPPVAEAGPDQTVEFGALMTLDGSGSSDPEGDTLTYRWTAPSGVTLSSATVVRPTFTASTVGTYQFALVVNDGLVDSRPSEMEVVVVAFWPSGYVHCGGVETAIVDVTNPATGQMWMDRNLGASRAATSRTDEAAYGDLYQWGRFADGHQCRSSSTISTRSSTDWPGHGRFITSSSAANWDWRSPQNADLWQGLNGVNNPCPAGYRLPTAAELDAERQSWSSNNRAGAFASPLK